MNRSEFVQRADGESPLGQVIVDGGKPEREHRLASALSYAGRKELSQTRDELASADLFNPARVWRSVIKSPVTRYGKAHCSAPSAEPSI
jgi:hypothetical protein